MSHLTCCIVNCKNTGKNSKCKFYRFPTSIWKLEQREKWIAAVKRKNPDGSSWYPKPWDLICSDHFVGRKKSEEEASPSYIPTIFPPVYRSKTCNEEAAVSRHKRFMQRRIKKAGRDSSNSISINQPCVPYSMETEIIKVNEDFVTINQACQVFIFSKPVDAGKTFICNRYVSNGICDAEIQTEINRATAKKSSQEKEKKTK